MTKNASTLPAPIDQAQTTDDLQIEALLTPQDLEALKVSISTKMQNLDTKRSGAAFAQGVNKGNSNPIMDATIKIIDESISEFLENFFNKHP